MTLRMLPAAALAAATAVLAPATPALAHGPCSLFAAAPYQIYTSQGLVIDAIGQVNCEESHDPATYSVTVCLYYSPVVVPAVDDADLGIGLFLPLGGLVTCGPNGPAYESRSAHGMTKITTHPCHYPPGYYQTYVFDGRAGAVGSHTNLQTKTARSRWVLIDGTACLS